MKSARLPDYLQHIRQAAQRARDFVAGMTREGFERDLRTQQAVEMNLIVMGEAASRVLEHHADFAQRHPQLPWREMRGMRNRMAHGYFDINLDVVWNTVQAALPALLAQLDALPADV
ncbi:MAG: DUF86 domain-containing protein [Roseateles sp.]|uniref:HepT-like ribonuclease domain-containing protein n=1 Tax=Roseateles sp. TaxID=1971397 RepID=UPI0039E77006